MCLTLMLPALGTYFCSLGLSQTLHFSNPAVNLLRALHWQKTHPTKWTNKNLIRFLPDFLPPLLQLSAGAVAASQGTRRATHQSLIQSHFDSTQHQISLVKVSNHILARLTFYRVCHSPNEGMDKHSLDQHREVLLSKASNRKSCSYKTFTSRGG